MFGLFDIKSIIVAFALVLVAFMAWTPLFYIIPVVGFALFLIGFGMAMTENHSVNGTVLYMTTLQYLFIPCVVSIIYILFTHVRFV